MQLLCNIQLQHGAVPHSSKEEKREQELLQQEEKKKEINMEEQSQGNECRGEEISDKISRIETQNPWPKQNGEDKSKQAQEQTENELIQQKYIQKQEEIIQNQRQNELEKHKDEIEHVPKRSKLDEN